MCRAYSRAVLFWGWVANENLVLGGAGATGLESCSILSRCRVLLGVESSYWASNRHEVDQYGSGAREVSFAVLSRREKLN